VVGAPGGRTSSFTRINIEPIILKNKIEDLRKLSGLSTPFAKNDVSRCRSALTFVDRWSLLVRRLRG
jgi:hypothetical protein